MYTAHMHHDYLLLPYTFPSLILHPYDKTTAELFTYINITFSTLCFLKGSQIKGFLEDSLFFPTVNHLININTDSCVMLYYIFSPHLSVNTFCLNYKNFLCQKHIHHRENITHEQWLPCKLGLTHSITHARVLYKVY